MKFKTIVVTGGAGFIGTNFIKNTLGKNREYRIINIDALTYAGNPLNLDDVSEGEKERYSFVHGNICDRNILSDVFKDTSIEGIVHFAAESHVDRSIDDPSSFIFTNINGTFNLLEESLGLWRKKGEKSFRFVHVSTDEVYGSLGNEGLFTEETAYDPSSPYSASKAASDHLAKAYYRTYGLPVIVTNCSNNYGPYQFPEKLIPLMIMNILEEKPLPVYGDGKNVRDWLYVIDHCDAVLNVFENGKAGETYNIGGNSEKENIEIVNILCDIMDKKLGRDGKKKSRNLIRFVEDRPGHDWRYAIDASKIKRELGWEPSFSFDSALEKTVDWYMKNLKWVESVKSGEYRNWISKNYDNRLEKTK